MNQRTNEILFSLLRSVICGTECAVADISMEEFIDLLSLSRKHDVEHLIITALDNNGLTPENCGDIKNKVLETIYRYEQLNYEFDKICKVFETTKIPFMPLKGAVIRKCYPEEWMRTSCDIDILVRDKDLEKAVLTLADGCGFEYLKKGSHDVALVTQSKIRVELHYTLIEENVSESVSKILGEVWESAEPCEGCVSMHSMCDEMFCFYHIAHMAKHFLNGGCGIKPFIDFWILESNCCVDNKEYEVLLKRGKLYEFSEAVRKLSKVWFGDAEKDGLTEQMESYILDGGVYGDSKNRIAVRRQEKGSSKKYLFSRIFLPYDELKFHYPILQKHRFLTPIIEIVRWFRLIFCGDSKRVLAEIHQINKITEQETESTGKFLADIGLLDIKNGG